MIPGMKRFTLILLILCSFTTLSFAKTKIIAHRGFSAKAPENTIAAFKKAIRSGADYFELDVHKNADDSVVVIHDATIDRVASGGETGKVADMSFEQIRAVRMGYPEKFGKKFRREGIPTLKEALACARRNSMWRREKIKVCVEIKAPEVEASVMKTINDLRMNDQVIIFAFDYNVLKNIRELDPVIPVLYLRSVVNEETVQMVNAIKGTAIGAGLKTPLTTELLELAHANGIELWQWTVNKPEDMQSLLDIGADGIITNHPDVALKLRKKFMK
jgi:glycerophosphoryl diester phosphodiesterase